MSVAFWDEQYAKTQRHIIVDVLLVVTMLSADQANAIILVVESSAPALRMTGSAIGDVRCI